MAIFWTFGLKFAQPFFQPSVPALGWKNKYGCNKITTTWIFKTVQKTFFRLLFWYITNYAKFCTPLLEILFLYRIGGHNQSIRTMWNKTTKVYWWACWHSCAVCMHFKTNFSCLHLFIFFAVGYWIRWYISSWEESDCYLKLRK